MTISRVVVSADEMMKVVAEEFFSAYSPVPVNIRRTTDPASPDFGKEMRELSFLFTITNPRDRLVYCKPVDIFNLVGLWVWLLAGNEDVSPIEFYNPIARRFVDEGVDSRRLRGSWGSRLVGSGAVDKVIRLLKESPDTRRAVIPVFSLEDVGYESRNLPCLTSIQFATKEGRLNAYVMMRSQAAIGVLPYDTFLLTMLHEFVAMRAGIPLGEYTVFMPLCGVRENEEPIIRGIVRERSVRLDAPMPAMDELAPGQLSLFLMCERKTRAGRYPAEEVQQLPGYWQDFISVTDAKKKGVWLDTLYYAFPVDFVNKCIQRGWNRP